MTLYDYKMLSEDEQWDTLWDKGKFLANLKIIDKSFSLYAIDKFFVEVVYDAEQNTITEVRSFKTGHLLDKYSVNFDCFRN